MTFIYPLGSGSVWHNNELRLSISSIRKHCTDKNIRIIVCGDPPPDDIPDVEYLSVPKISTSRYQIVAYNLYIAWSHYRPSQAILMNDDFFCLQPFSFDTLPLWYSEPLRERIARQSISPQYRMNLVASLRDPDDLNFAVHYPMPVRDCDSMIEVLDYCRRHDQVSIRNLYGNIRRKEGEQTIRKADNKINTPMNAAQLTVALDGVDWFSIGDNLITPETAQVLTSLLS